MKPTDAQVREFWEKYGFKYVRIDNIPWHKLPEDYQTNYWYANNHWIYPDGSKHKVSPPTDLTSLFEWAVPKLKGKYELMISEDYEMYEMLGKSVCLHSLENPECSIASPIQYFNDWNELADALFWALYPVLVKE